MLFWSPSPSGVYVLCVALGRAGPVGSRGVLVVLASDRWCLSFRDTMDSVKQSAALCLLRLYRTSPDLVPMGDWTSRVVHLLNDQHLVNAGRESTPTRRVAFVGIATVTAAQCSFLRCRACAPFLGMGPCSQAWADFLQARHTDEQDRGHVQGGRPCGVPVCALPGWDGGALWSCLISVCMATHGPGPTVLFRWWMKTGRCRVSTLEGTHGGVTLGVESGRSRVVSGSGWPEFCCLAYGHTTLNAPDLVRILMSK